MKDNFSELRILEHSDFGEIRTTIDENGNVLFGAFDVAKALGYKNPNDAVSRHCRAIVKHDSPISGKIQEINFIYEPDLYRLLIKSKLPSAVEFERWVFEDVLPSLRKYGMYATDELLANDEKFLEVKEQLKFEKGKIKELRKFNKDLKAERTELIKTNSLLERDNKCLQVIVDESMKVIEEVEPIVEYVDVILSCDLDMTATQIAADYGISAIRLNNLLHEAGIQRKVNGQWVLYREFMNMGLTSSFTGFLEKRGHYYVQTRWTQQGRLMIHQIMKEAGIDAVGYETENGGQYE